MLDEKKAHSKDLVILSAKRERERSKKCSQTAADWATTNKSSAIINRSSKLTDFQLSDETHPSMAERNQSDRRDIEWHYSCPLASDKSIPLR
jgi:hypothetical protein